MAPQVSAFWFLYANYPEAPAMRVFVKEDEASDLCDMKKIIAKHLSLEFERKILSSLACCSGRNQNGPVSMVVEYYARQNIESDVHKEEKRDILTEMNNSYRKILRGLTDFTPSQAAKSSEYRNIQGGEKPIQDGRYKVKAPKNTTAPPIELFNPVFAHFAAKAKDETVVVPEATVLLTAELMDAFAGIYGSEKERCDKIHGILGELLEPFLVPRFEIRLFTEEVKNEVGDGGSDPSTQSAFSFARTIKELKKRVTGATNCPMFLIAHRLTDFIWIPIRSVLDQGRYISIARVMLALNDSIKLLASWYTTKMDLVFSGRLRVHDPDKDASLHPRFFPSAECYHVDGQPVRFKFLRPLEPAISCVTYLAETLDDKVENRRKVVVKFVNGRYCEDAHKKLAQHGYAPQLLYFGLVDNAEDGPSYGSLRMMVMDYVEGSTAAVAMRDGKLPARFLDKLTTIIHHLHGRGFVFGDLRQPNVMITKGEDVQLIDFDWAGMEGEVRYPVAISNCIKWPDNVKGLAPIEKQHDLYMLQPERWE